MYTEVITDNVQLFQHSDKNGITEKETITAKINNEYAGDIKVSTSFDPKHYWITALYVVPQFRGRGIAKTLVNAVIQLYSDKPICLTPYAYKDKPKSDEELVSMYKHLGFKEISGQKHYLIYNHKHEITNINN